MVTDLTGQKFGRLVVLGRSENDKYGGARWLVRCECGATKAVLAGSIKAGRTRSCGCLHKEVAAAAGRKNAGHKYGLKHGHRVRGNPSPTYNSFRAACERCYNPNTARYAKYGGAGVTVCDRWNPKAGGSFENFLQDMGERPPGTTLGRFGDTGNYSPGNVSWQTLAEQVTNRRPDRKLNQWICQKQTAKQEIAA